MVVQYSVCCLTSISRIIYISRIISIFWKIHVPWKCSISCISPRISTHFYTRPSISLKFSISWKISLYAALWVTERYLYNTSTLGKISGGTYTGILNKRRTTGKPDGTNKDRLKPAAGYVLLQNDKPFLYQAFHILEIFHILENILICCTLSNREILV